ncbi:MAG: hypothetical protein HRU31_01105 [Rhodobacteraceae bacterium]|nr:hypothetical protein [Paracoccaceae bacterium]
MGAFVRFLLILLVVQTVIYLFLTVRLRRAERERLEEIWHKDGIGGDREAYVAKGLTKYADRLDKRLLIFVYIVPIVALGVLVYVANSV